METAETAMTAAEVRRDGTRHSLVGLPAIKPEVPDSFLLFAIVGPANAEEAIDVTETAAYAEMYADVQRMGSAHTVELYTI